MNAKAAKAMREMESEDPKAASLAKAVGAYTQSAQDRVDVLVMLLNSAAIVFARSINPGHEKEMRATFMTMAEQCLDRAFLDDKN